MSLYEMYNSVNNFDRVSETDKFIKSVEIRCTNLIFCGDKLPYHIRDIKPHSMLKKELLVFDLVCRLGVDCKFDGDVLVIKGFKQTIPSTLKL